MKYDTTIHSRLKVDKMQVGLFFYWLLCFVQALLFYPWSYLLNFIVRSYTPTNPDLVSQDNPERSSFAAIHFRQLSINNEDKNDSSKAGAKASKSWEATAYTVIVSTFI